MLLSKALGGGLDKARLSDDAEAAWTLVRDVRIARLANLSLTEVRDLDHVTWSQYDDLLTAMDMTNRRRQSEGQLPLAL